MINPKLRSYWHEYKLATLAKPYDPVRVQALGMRFCAEWKEQLPAISKVMDIPIDEIEYQHHHTIMPELSEIITCETSCGD